MASSISILFRYGLFVFVLYLCMKNLFSNSSNFPSGNKRNLHLNINQINLATGPSKDPKVTNIVLMVVDALRADMVSSSEYSANWPNVQTIAKKGMAQCFTSSLTSPSVTSPRIKVC